MGHLRTPDVISGVSILHGRQGGLAFDVQVDTGHADGLRSRFSIENNPNQPVVDVNLRGVALEVGATDPLLSAAGTQIALNSPAGDSSNAITVRHPGAATNSVIIGRNGSLTLNGVGFVSVPFKIAAHNEANERFRILEAGRIEWGPGAAAAPDVNLYRGLANVLATDDDFWSAESVVAHATEANQVWVGATASSVLGPGITFGSAMDTNIYRRAANQLATDDTIVAKAANSTDDTIYFVVGSESFARVVMEADGTINWGPGSGGTDLRLYRSAVSTLRTDGVFHSVSTIWANQGAASQTIIGEILASTSGVLFGSAGDTNLYRSAADTLKTDDQIFAVGQLVGSLGANQVNVGAVGPSSKAGLLLGDAGDTNLYRDAASILRTDDSFRVGNDKVFIGSLGSIDVKGTQGDGFLSFEEQSSDPSAPAANGARIFAVDNGGGKTQLVARFNSGANQVIATQP